MAAAFGVALRRHRERLLLTQEALAYQAGISVRTIRDLESGRVRGPRAVSVHLLSDALHLNDERRFEFDALALSDRPTAQLVDRPAPRQPPLDPAGLAGRSAALSILDGAVEAGSGHGTAVISYVAGLAGIGNTAPARPWPYRGRVPVPGRAALPRPRLERRPPRPHRDPRRQPTPDQRLPRPSRRDHKRVGHGANEDLQLMAQTILAFSWLR
jgi:transcriptional regulator with XRE-family HTH domain